MLCPNCGTRTTNRHKFCRNCGMNLEPISKALAAHLSHGGAAAAEVTRAAERRAARRMLGGLFAGVFIVLVGLLTLSVLSGKGFRLIGVIAALLGLLVALYAILRPLRPGVKMDEEPAAPPAVEGATTTTGRLLHEETVSPASSITERTTELLGVEAKDREPRV